MPATTARADIELRMVETLVDCAHELGVTLAAAAKSEAVLARKLELFEAFQRSFQAVRLGIRLSLTLRAPPKPAAMRETANDADEAELSEPAERADAMERPERERAETDRERDSEPVSLPKFLSTLGLAAAAARRLDGRLPAHVAADTLPRLDQSLAQARSSPSPAEPAGATVLVRRRPETPAGAPRARLLGSAAAHPVTLRPPPRPSG